MKKYINLFFVLFLTSSLLFVSCSDDDDDNDDDGGNTDVKNYYYMSEGSYRIMMNEDSDNKTTYDSVAVTGIEADKDGKEAVVMSSFTSDTDGSFSDVSTNNYYSADGKKLYVHADFFSAQMQAISDIVDLGLTFENWYLVADEDGSSWNIYTKALTDQVVNYDIFSFTITGNFTIQGTNGGTETITVNGKDHEALKMNFSLGMKDADVSLATADGKLNLNTEITNYFVDGIGIVKTKTSAAHLKVELSALGQTQELINEEILGGSTSTLIRTNLPMTE